MEKACASTKAKGRSLLILECDARKLARQSLAIGSAVYELIKRLAPSVIRTELVRTTSEQQLLEELVHVKERHGVFDLILIFGHSNPHGLQLTAEKFFQWSVFVRWISMFTARL